MPGKGCVQRETRPYARGASDAGLTTPTPQRRHAKPWQESLKLLSPERQGKLVCLSCRTVVDKERDAGGQQKHVLGQPGLIEDRLRKRTDYTLHQQKGYSRRFYFLATPAQGKCPRRRFPDFTDNRLVSLLQLFGSFHL